MDKARVLQKRLAVFFLDVDHFKQINDTYGHDTGDELLIEFCSRVGNSVREKDTLARFGGDEFVILIPDLSDVTAATIIAERIFHSLKKEWKIKGLPFKLTTSIGIAFYQPYEIDKKTLLHHADLALYEAKKKGRNNFRIYESHQ